MKKLIVFMCGLAMLLPMIIVNSAADSIIEDFNSYADTAALQEKVIVGYGEPVISLDTVNKDGDTGGSMQYTVGTGWNVVVAQGIAHDWTDAKAIKFWAKADTSGMTTPTAFTKIWVAFDETDPWKRWSAGAGLPYMLIPKDGEPATYLTTTDSQNSVVLADGFEGYVILPISSFADDGTMNLSAICQILFQTDTYFTGTKINIDSIELLDASPLDEPEIEFNFTAPAELDASAVLDEDALAYSVDLNIANIASPSNLYTNLSELIGEFYENPQFDDFALYDMLATKTGLTEKASLKEGKQAEITLSAPEGFNLANTKILLFVGGEVQAVTPTVTDGKLVFKISEFTPFAIVDETDKAASSQPDDSSSPDDGSNPDTADSFVLPYLLVAVAVIAAGTAIGVKKAVRH